MSLTNESTNITLGQFLEEAEMFERSREYFDMLKESSEIELLERYLECQDYIMESLDDSNSTDGLITESTDNMDQIFESLETKKTALWGKVVSGVKKVINAVVTLFSRLLNFWKNGKELDHLKAEAKTITKINEDRMEATADHIRKILRGKQHAVDNLRDKVKEKDAEIAQLRIVSAKKDAEIARVHKMFKGVDANLYRELVAVENSISDEIVVDMPKCVSEIHYFTKEISDVCQAYKEMRTKYAGNSQFHVKRARDIADLLKKAKASRNVVVRKTINPAWIEETYKSLVQSRDRIMVAIDGITGKFNDANATEDKSDTSKKTAIKSIRSDASDNFLELQRNITMLLNEWVYLANNSIKTIKEIMDIRSNNIRIEQQILADIKKSAA